MGDSKRKIFKFDQDDILEILTEYPAENNGFGTFQSKAILLGEPGEDLRLVAVVGVLEDDDIQTLDLEKIDVEVNFNGSHSSIYTHKE